MGPSSYRKTSAGVPLIIYYGELYNYFTIHYNVIIMEIKCTINVVMDLISQNHPCPLPGPWKSCLPQNCSLLPEGLGTAIIKNSQIDRPSGSPTPVQVFIAKSFPLSYFYLSSYNTNSQALPPTDFNSGLSWL